MYMRMHVFLIRCRGYRVLKDAGEGRCYAPLLQHSTLLLLLLLLLILLLLSLLDAPPHASPTTIPTPVPMSTTPTILTPLIIL